MVIKKAFRFLFALVILGSGGLFADPVLYELVKKAAGTPTGSEEWAAVKSGFEEDIQTDLDWAGEQGDTIREVLAIHHPELLRRFTFMQVQYPRFWILVASAATEGSAELWSKVRLILKKCPNMRRIDWNPIDEPSARTLIRIYNPHLLEEIYGEEQRPRLWSLLANCFVEEGRGFEKVEDGIRDNPDDLNWKPEKGEGILDILRICHPDYYADRVAFPAVLAQDYEYVKQLGSGCFALVKEARQRATGMRVAIKVLRRERYQEETVAFPPEEVLLMKGLDHPHIVKMVECARVDDDTLCLVTELASGGELFAYLQARRLQESESRGFMWQIVSGVDYLHKNAIVHRDLKLENLVFDEKRNLKIIDLGLASRYGTKKLCQSCGSTDYAPPEILLHKEYDGPEVDVWSLGVILYCMVAGGFPFEDATQVVRYNYFWPVRLAISGGVKALVAAIFQPSFSRITIPGIIGHHWMK
jgi:hypothetical protein